MGEIIPFVAVALLVLGILVAVILLLALAIAVIKPLDQEDMVERVKIKIDGQQALDLVESLKSTNDISFKKDRPASYEFYEKRTGRLVRIEVEHGIREVQENPKVVSSNF